MAAGGSAGRGGGMGMGRAARRRLAMTMGGGGGGGRGGGGAAGGVGEIATVLIDLAELLGGEDEKSPAIGDGGLAQLGERVVGFPLVAGAEIGLGQEGIGA